VNNAAAKQEMMGRQEQEIMGRNVLSDASFIGTTGDSVMICFPRKKMSFCFNHPRNPDA
jgi:hypothetical protein